jgi:hypothetical protein
MRSSPQPPPSPPSPPPPPLTIPEIPHPATSPLAQAADVLATVSGMVNAQRDLVRGTAARCRSLARVAGAGGCAVCRARCMQ